MQISRRMIQRLTRARGLMVNGKPPFLRRKTRSGDKVSVLVAAPEEASLPPVEMEIAVLYEDGDLVVVDKPSGLLVHPTSEHHTRTLAHGLAYHFARQRLEAKVRPLHRIDRETSGAVVFAKSAFAHQHLDRQLREGGLGREYLAVVDGQIVDEVGTVDAPIGKAKSNPNLRAVVNGAQEARTHFEVLERLEAATVVLLKLETGRTHQIRVHMAHLGHAVVGDASYGRGRSTIVFGRPALHSYRVTFTQPRSGELVRLEAPVPPDIEELLAKLR
jgi:23S rRNA pseudouridine1911/1915/1917 synthase